MLQQAVNGLALGGVYALIAVSFTLVFGTLRIINLAQGTLVAIGGFGAFLLLTHWGFELWSVLLVAAALGALVNMLFDMVAFRPLRRSDRRDTEFASLVASLGLLLMVNGIMSIVSRGRSFPMPVDVVPMDFVTMGSIKIPAFRIVMFLVAGVSAAALYLFLRATPPGRAMRAVGWQVEVARLLGIPAGRLITGAFAFAGALAAVSGVLVAAAFNFVVFTMGNPYLLRGLAAIILGGLGNVVGAILGGITIGLAEAFAVQVMPGQWRDAIAFAIMVTVLIIKPTGLMGEDEPSAVL